MAGWQSSFFSGKKYVKCNYSMSITIHAMLYNVAFPSYSVVTLNIMFNIL